VSASAGWMLYKGKEILTIITCPKSKFLKTQMGEKFLYTPIMAQVIEKGVTLLTGSIKSLFHSL
jgi:hypothetical protein